VTGDPNQLLKYGGVAAVSALAGYYLYYWRNRDILLQAKKDGIPKSLK